jgi:hypothetical protein
MLYHHCFSTLLWNMPRAQENQQRLILKGIHQLLAYADDVNMVEENIDTMQKNTNALLYVSKGVGLEVNPELESRLNSALNQRR